MTQRSNPITLKDDFQSTANQFLLKIDKQKKRNQKINKIFLDGYKLNSLRIKENACKIALTEKRIETLQTQVSLFSKLVKDAIEVVTLEINKQEIYSIRDKAEIMSILFSRRKSYSCQRKFFISLMVMSLFFQAIYLWKSI